MNTEKKQESSLSDDLGEDLVNFVLQASESLHSVIHKANIIPSTQPAVKRKLILKKQPENSFKSDFYPQVNLMCFIEVNLHLIQFTFNTICV